MAGIGHNSGDVLDGSAQSQLRSVVERVERLDAEIAEIQEARKEVFAEAKGNGFDTKALRKLVVLRRMDPEKRAEGEAILDLYEHAVSSKAKGKAKLPVDDDEDDIA
jgi:uncharacterized protein (UPF0335 family)